MIVTNSEGKMFNAELCLEAEKDPEELRMLGKALLEELKRFRDDNRIPKHPIMIDECTRIDDDGDLEIDHPRLGGRWFSQEALEDILDKMKNQKVIG